MPRKSRIDAVGPLHHIIARGIDRDKIFHANGITLESLAERVAEIFDMSSSALWIAGKHRWRVRAKSVFVIMQTGSWRSVCQSCLAG